MKNNSLKESLRVSNIIICACLACLGIILSYAVWSKFGPYTIFSFLTSVILYGGLFGIVGLLIDEKIRSHFE